MFHAALGLKVHVRARVSSDTRADGLKLAGGADIQRINGHDSSFPEGGESPSIYFLTLSAKEIIPPEAAYRSRYVIILNLLLLPLLNL
jgi:hypothetical protein